MDTADTHNYGANPDFVRFSPNPTRTICLMLIAFSLAGIVHPSVDMLGRSITNVLRLVRHSSVAISPYL